VKTLFFDCGAGISGDMTVAALLDLGVPLNYLEGELRKLSLPEGSWQISLERTARRGITAACFRVACHDHHSHRHFSHIRDMITEAPLRPRAKELALAIFSRLAEAEARVHGTTVEEVHFHEVGAMDSIIDIVGAAVCLEWLGVESCHAAPLPLGGGFVQTAHGLLPVPAPATALLLEGLPVHRQLTEGERVTPTGAAIVATLCGGSGPLPPLTVTRVGSGAGERDFPDVPNILRLVLGEKAATLSGDEVEVLETNIDDMNPEILAHVCQGLLAAGALDVSLTPIIMKKGRPGFRLTLLATSGGRDPLARAILQQTTAAGVRFHRASRLVLPRGTVQRSTSLGAVRVTSFTTPAGGVRLAPEYEECRRLAEEHNLPLLEVYRIVEGEACTP
jgi:uncharacterized protein (TIGR00299 family) protein